MAHAENTAETMDVTTAIIGLLAISGKTVNVLLSLNALSTDRTAQVNHALREVKQCRSSLYVLHKTLSLLQAGALEYPQRGAWIQVDYLVATLTDTALAFSELQTLCDFVEGHELSLGLAPRPVWPWEDQFRNGMQALSSRIRWQNLSITMMMTILNWSVVT